MRVKDFMTSPAVTITPDRSISDAARRMLDNRISGLPVVTPAGRLVGIISEHDLLRRRTDEGRPKRPHWLQLMTNRTVLYDEPTRFSTLTVADVMTADPVTITEAAPLEEAGRVLAQRGFKRLPVMRGPALVGVISRADLMRALPRAIGTAERASKRDVMTDERLVELERQYWLQRTRSLR